MMGTMLSTEKEEVYKRMVLTIPEEVLPEDIPTIINWFDYYGIADVKNVDVREHPEQEYYVEDRPFYGYAVIEICKWYKNNGSLSFYENLIAGNAKMVYEDPKYWNVQFYEARTLKEEAYPVNYIVENLETNNSHPFINEDEARWEYDGPGYADILGNRNDEDYFSYGEEEPDWEQEIKNKMKSEQDVVEEDVPTHEDYEYKEIETEEDLQCKYVPPKNHKTETKSKRKRKEDKSKRNNLNTENITLEELIVKKNKNYVKREKKKLFKNVWSRRLRQKLDA